GAFVGAGEDVQTAEDDSRAAPSVPGGELENSGGEGEVDADADDLRHRPPRRRTLEQVFVPVLDLPTRRRRAGDAGERERGREHVLAEAGVRILRIKRVDQQRV